MSESAQSGVYGRTVQCAECGCDDADKLSKASHMVYSRAQKQWITMEAIECKRCGSVSAL